MAKVEVSVDTYPEETIRVLDRCGCLLVSGSMRKANVMAIGWGLIGPLWAKHFFIVAVRPSRYTHKFVEETGHFTVNVPQKGMEDIVSYCGSVSGRDHNKFGEKGLRMQPGREVNSPIISNCVIHYECKVAYKTRVISSGLPGEILDSCYPHGDYHTLYFGEILATYADEEARMTLPG